MTSTTSAAIAGAVRVDETIKRLGGHGDDFHMSWMADDRQVFAVCDGCGWEERPVRRFNSRLHFVTGGPEDAEFTPAPGYPELVDDFSDIKGRSRYYGFATIAFDGAIYQFLSTPNVPFRERGPRFVGAKLIYSLDDGRTWRNQDGSTPVIWEPWEERSKDNMFFFYEPQDSFSILSALQMGRNYGANKDGFLYFYAPNGNTETTMNQLATCRVRREAILDRRAYEYFAGSGSTGKAEWSRDIYDRVPVYTYPSGWVNKTTHPWSWVPSVAYDEPLGVYIKVNAGTGVAPDGHWFGTPSYLGIYTAPNPWGPWTQILEETAWTPGGDEDARCYSPIISPKWISDDGKSFWLLWSDFQMVKDSDEDRERTEWARENDSAEFFRIMKDGMPYYAFNAQRVDLVFD